MFVVYRVDVATWKFWISMHKGIIHIYIMVLELTQIT
jgi:hypothetical protein